MTLECHFSVDPYPKRDTRMAFAEELGVKEVQIQHWFQNRRARSKIRREHVQS